jgi:hypothetical protein
VSAAISPATGRSYGVQRVCRLWALPRSSFYHAANRNTAPWPPARCGPAPPVGEASLLAAIKADLASSPFRGEGHRKVWARLRYGLGLRVGRNRVLRLMREHQPWVRGRWADGRKFAGFSVACDERIRGVCLSCGGGWLRFLDREDLLRR